MKKYNVTINMETCQPYWTEYRNVNITVTIYAKSIEGVFTRITNTLNLIHPQRQVHSISVQEIINEQDS